MKKLVILAFILTGVSAATQAQTKTPISLSKGFLMDAWTLAGVSGSEFQTIDITLAPGWAFNRTLFGRVQLDATVGMWDVDGAKTWRENIAIGPALGVNVWRLPRSGATLGVVGSAGRSLDNKNNNWSYACYDLGVEFYDNHFLVGLGVRHHDSFRTSVDGNRTNFYVKIGWKLFGR